MFRKIIFVLLTILLKSMIFKILLKLDTIKKIDKNLMYQTYDNWPNISDEAFRKKYEKIHYKGIKHIVFAGMGGSGHISDIFYSIFSKTKVYVDVVKGYHLPHTVDKKTLVIPISISGNTVETLSILRDAKKKKSDFIE